MAYHAFSHTVQGFSHAKHGQACQDASGVIADPERQVYIAASADGHGSSSCFRSDKGAKFAVDSALEAFSLLADEYSQEMDANEALPQLSRYILKIWNEKVEEDLKENPFSTDEFSLAKIPRAFASGAFNSAYGTTLIAFCIIRGRWFAAQIGDGRCVAISRAGEISEPVPWDDKCRSNVTTSLCDDDAVNEFRFFTSTELPAAVFVGSDGIDGSYSDARELYSFYSSVYSIYLEHGKDAADAEMREYLPTITKRGSGDDVTVAAVVDLSCMDLADILKKYRQTAKEEARLEAEQFAKAFKEEEAAREAAIAAQEAALAEKKRLEEEERLKREAEIAEEERKAALEKERREADLKAGLESIQDFTAAAAASDINEGNYMKIVLPDDDDLDIGGIVFH